MDGELIYLDPAAILRLVIESPETDALRDELSCWPERVTSSVSKPEVVREARRRSAEAEGLARKVLSGLALVNVDEEVLRLATELGVPDVRTLDALHVATALSLAGDLGAFVSYDGRMLLAADAAGLKVLVPGASP